VSETAQRRSKIWALWVVRAALALTVLQLSIGAISSIWLGQRTETFWWLTMALPQVSIALLAVLICWDGRSRPAGVGVAAGLLNMFGLMAALMFLKWLPALIGALTVVAMVVRPREWVYSDPPPPRFGWLRR
jgi:hypothetical protein